MMARAGEPYTYDRVQRGFHWLMAALIVVALALGIYAAWQVPGTSPRREILDIHKSIGLTVLMLLPLRFVYRLVAGGLVRGAGGEEEGAGEAEGGERANALDVHRVSFGCVVAGGGRC